VSSLVSAIVHAARRRRVAVLAVVTAVALVSTEGIRRLSFDSNILSLLPSKGRIFESFTTFVARFGTLDQLYIVFTAPDGHTISEYRDDIEEWIKALRAAPEIQRVDAGVPDRSRDLSWLADRQLLLFSGSALDDALRRFTPDGIRSNVAASRELLAVPSPDVAAIVRQDPLRLFDLLRATLGGPQTGLSIGAGTEGYVTADRRGRLVIGRPKRPPFDSAFSHALDRRLQEIRQSMAAAAAANPDAIDDALPPPMRVDIAGGHRIAVETESIVRRESILNSLGSLALILPLLFLVFRSFWLVAVGSLPSALSLVVVLGALGFAGTRLSAAATGSAAMLFGLGVDGVVLLYVSHQLAMTRWTDAGRRGEPPDAGAIEGPSSSMLLGMFTTAATFYGLMFVDFPSLRQLGRLIGHSMVACAVLTLLLVPALLPRRPAGKPRRSLILPHLASWIVRRRTPILATAAALTVVLGAAMLRLRIDPTLDRLRSTTEAARLEERLGPAFGLPGDAHIVVAEGAALDALLETNEQLVQRLSADLPEVAVYPPSRVLPSAASQARTVARVGDAGLSVDAIRASLEEARVAAGFAPGAFDPFTERLPALLDAGQRLSYDDFLSHDAADLISRFVARDGERWRLATYLFPTTSEQVSRVRDIVNDVDTSQTLTGLPLVNKELARRFMPDFVTGLAAGTAIVVLLVFATFRNLRLSILALLPTAVGLVWAAGLFALAGVELDLFATFAVVTFVGIGVDYGVHLVHRYRERGDAQQATAELAPVILMAGAITMLGYGTLMWSSYPPLRSIGLVSTVSVVALAAASVLVLPALLTRSLGK
jgi:predicted RND superfamily exporter protein